MAKANKTASIKTHITEAQRALIDEYCEVNDTNISEFIRECITERLNKFQKERK